MKEFNYHVTDPVGIHARPAGLLVKEAAKFKSNISLTKEGKTVDAKKIMAVMALGVKQNQEVKVSVDGEDEATAFAALEKFFKENF
ncbi:MAG: HPr family phosphocarrier protein [Lachnospiraceae bacterium]|nr:HPr family phosphocarrier protein [Lachnospiraceae bacterium]